MQLSKKLHWLLEPSIEMFDRGFVIKVPTNPGPAIRQVPKSSRVVTWF